MRMQILENFLSSDPNPQARGGFFNELEEKVISQYKKDQHFPSFFDLKSVFSLSAGTAILLLIIFMSPFSNDLKDIYQMNKIENEIISTEREFQIDMETDYLEEEVFYEEVLNIN